MSRRGKWISIAAIVLVFALGTLPFWGLGPAVFLDSTLTVIARAPSPDGKRIAQVERIVVGGAPSIVVMVRPRWMPDWYLTDCAAASHYREAKAQVFWVSDSMIEVSHTDDRLFWDIGSAPFHNAPCDGLTVVLDKTS